MEDSRQVAATNQSAWEVGKIAFGLLPELIIDQQGIPHLSFHDDYRVRYATIMNDTWVTHPLDATKPSREHALTVDTSGHPHVAYLYGSTLIVATDTSGQWTKENITQSGELRCLSMVMDPHDQSVFAYYAVTDQQIACVRQRYEAWHPEVVASVGRYDGALSLCLDSQNRPHISFYDFTDETLKYARWNGTQWLIETLDECSALYLHLGISMALEAQDHPHIAYMSNDEKLKYATFNGSLWHLDQIYDPQGVVCMVSLCLDTSDHSHIALLQQIPGPPEDSVNEIVYLISNGSTWIHDLVATQEVGWYGVAIALNPQNDHPTIIFQHEVPVSFEDSLYYATKDHWRSEAAEIQYNLTVNSPYGNPQGQGWYPLGSLATVSITTPDGVGIQHVFTGWSGDITASSPTAYVSMYQDQTVTANWIDDSTQLYGILAAILVIACVTLLLERRMRTTL